MTAQPTPVQALGRPERYSIIQSPFMRAPEGVRTVYLVTMGAAAGPLIAGLALFGWRALWVATLSILTCATVEKLYFRITRVPALTGRSHAFLTGLLLALTLPADAPWYVPVVGGAFAVLVGKAIFGGVGHFLWQPALVGRLAVTVLLVGSFNPMEGPVLAREKIVVGDVRNVKRTKPYHGWKVTPAPPGADGFMVPKARTVLRGLTLDAPEYTGLVTPRTDIPRWAPSALSKLPPLNDYLYGARPGGIGETCVVVIVVAGLYLMYRNYVKWQLPVSMLAAAWLVVAAAPVQLVGPNGTTDVVWWPLTHEGLDIGFTYVNYQLFSGGLVLAAFLLAPEMTSRPVTTGGQVVFGLSAGALAMILQMYSPYPIPAYMAVLVMNTFTPLIDALWRPRVLGQKRLRFLRGVRS